MKAVPPTVGRVELFGVTMVCFYFKDLETALIPFI